MNEYRIQRLKEDLTYAQQRNKNKKQQLANYKKVHEKDLKEIERLKEENTILKQTMSNNSLLINENALLKDGINKAIEYIKSYMPNYDFDKTNLIKVLDILERVDKE